jgi:hypothetical protein
MVMKVDIHDLARMFASLSEYFQRESFVIANAQPFSTPINLNNNPDKSGAIFEFTLPIEKN